VTVGSHGGEHVQVEGSFDNWSTRQQLQRSGREFTVIKLLPPGVYQVCIHIEGGS
jgi:5'-AMP-activated protein kinase regulatory beta subunit